jgi:hypothetical protein
MSTYSHGGLLGLRLFVRRHGEVSEEIKTVETMARSRTDWRDKSRQTDAQGNNWIISWATAPTLSSALLFCLSSSHVSVRVSSTVNGRSAALPDPCDLFVAPGEHTKEEMHMLSQWAPSTGKQALVLYDSVIVSHTKSFKRTMENLPLSFIPS